LFKKSRKISCVGSIQGGSGGGGAHKKGICAKELNSQRGYPKGGAPERIGWSRCLADNGSPGKRKFGDKKEPSQLWSLWNERKESGGKNVGWAGRLCSEPRTST